MHIRSVADMQETDRMAMEDAGIPGEILMENAGAAAFRVLRRVLNDFRADSSEETPSVLVFCGPGNNGGDGLVAARHALSAGMKPVLVVPGDPDKWKGASAVNHDAVRKLNIPLISGPEHTLIRQALKSADAVVDGIFGTGLSRPPAGEYLAAIRMINETASAKNRPPFILSLDIPSGVNGDTGRIPGEAVQAHATVSFGLPKPGNLLYPGAAHGGRLHIAPISFPPNLLAAFPVTGPSMEVNPLPRLGPRPTDGHKYTFGSPLFICGGGGYFGAPRLAASAFLKSGGGLARLALPRSLMPVVAARADHPVFLPLEETASGAARTSNYAVLMEAAKRSDLVIIGCGLTRDPEVMELARRLIRDLPVPVIIDGDAIHAVKENPEWTVHRRYPTLFTPHDGELCALAAISTDRLRENPLGIPAEIAVSFNAHLVRKGARSLIISPDGRLRINLSGNSGMATAGSGDILAGVIAAMISPCARDLFHAASAGVFLHGLAGDLAAAAIGEDGITADDILNFLPSAIKMARNDIDPALRERYTLPVAY